MLGVAAFAALATVAVALSWPVLRASRDDRARNAAKNAPPLAEIVGRRSPVSATRVTSPSTHRDAPRRPLGEGAAASVWPAPRAGRYEFSEYDSSDRSRYTRFVEVESREIGNALRVTFRTSIDDHSQQTVEEREWSTSGIRWLSQAMPPLRGEQPFGCEWAPPVLVLPSRASVDSNWRNDSTCRSGAAVTRHTASERVDAIEEIEIALGRYLTLIVHSEARDSSSSGILEYQWRTWYAPDLGMRVKYVEDYNSPYMGKYTVTGELTRFTPKD